jgi:hypothetical protein
VAKPRRLNELAGAPSRSDVPVAQPATSGAEAGWTALRRRVNARIVALETYRYSWWVHWRELADYFLPRRYRWLITPNQWNRGSPINQRIIDNTQVIAARTLAAGMMSGITSPTRPWFRLTTHDKNLAGLQDVREWLDDCTDRIQQVLGSSNYYVAKAVQYLDLCVFGTAPLLIYEDLGAPDSKIIRCFNPCAGEYFCAVGRNFTVDTLYRKFTMTIDQVVREFGYENCSPSVQASWDNEGGNQLDREIVICHAIEPNAEFDRMGYGKSKDGVPNHFMYQEIFWEYGSSNDLALRVQGFFDQPFSCPRWDTTGNDAYGRCPAMDALGDTKQLQVEQKRKAQAIDKMVNPPMQADPAMKNEPASLNPGAVNYVPNIQSNVGFKPVFTVMPPIQELKEDIAECQRRIRDTFYNDLFQMISQLDTVRTATEIEARREEKLVLLGPVLERFNTEGLDPDIRRVFRIMQRNGLFKAPPVSLNNASIKAEYVSVLADQQRATITTAIERLFQFVGGVAAAVPNAIDKLDTDQTIDAYADALHVPADLVRAGNDLSQIRQQRASAEQAQQQAQVGAAAVQGAQTLSQTDVGGGQNALQMILQGGGGAGGGAGGAPPGATIQ